MAVVAVLLAAPLVVAANDQPSTQLTQDKFLASDQLAIDTNAAGIQAKRMLKQDDPKSPGYREKMIQDMLDDVSDLVDNDATEADWDKFRGHYEKKWDKYNKAVNKPQKSSSSSSKSKHKYKFEKEEETKSSGSHPVAMASSYDHDMRQDYVDEQYQEYDQLMKQGASSDQWKKWHDKWKYQWTHFGEEPRQDHQEQQGQQRNVEEQVTGLQSGTKGKKAMDQLQSLLNAFTSEEQSRQFWGIKDQSSFVPKKITVQFDNTHNRIIVVSDEVDAKGRPLEEWQMDRSTGHIIQTHRSKDGSEVRTTQKDLDINGLKKDLAEQNVEVISAELEKQRDTAYKIMYFFVAFIIFLFGLIYAFFQQSKAEEQANSRKGKYAHLNRNQLRSRAFEGKMDSLMSSKNTHRDDSGFGTNNLYHLSQEERGRFDDVDADNAQRTVFRKY